MKLIGLLLLVRCIQSSPVKTSLCCCGCSEKPCPVVGSNCPRPESPCMDGEDDTDVHCSELQQLWDRAATTDIPANSASSEVQLQQLQHTFFQERQQTDLITPFIGYTGRLNRSKSRVVDGRKPEIPGTEYIDKNAVFRDRKATTEIRFSPSRTNPTEIEANLANLDKMQHMLNDLQSMISTVKGLIDKEVGGPKSETMTKEETVESLPDGADNISEEEERQAIDDVIMRMKGAFRNMTKEGHPATEMLDASAPSAFLEDQSLPLIPMNSRPKRAVKKNAGNCNDEQLRELIDNNIGDDAKTSKRQIQRAAEKEFGGTFNVICSPCEFSFVISSQKYCEGFKDQVACFVFLQPPTSLRRVR